MNLLRPIVEELTLHYDQQKELEAKISQVLENRQFVL